jgi:hypothetical protein
MRIRQPANHVAAKSQRVLEDIASFHGLVFLACSPTTAPNHGHALPYPPVSSGHIDVLSMSSSRPQPGSRDSEAYELVSPEAAHSINPNGEPSVRSLDNDARPAGVNRRHRLSHSRSEQAADHVEAVGLLSRSPFANFKPPARGSGLHTALELVTQSTPSLFAAVVGSVMTGFVFDQVQFWPAFVRIQELFILVPVLLNLKGCLEMNLASRLSTSVPITPRFLQL